MTRSKVSTPSWRLRAGLLVAAASLAFALPAPVAVAREPGVVYEPGSPSYKEYSIPLEEARRDAGGGIPGTIESHAFGIGLSRRGAGRGGSRSGGGAGGGSARGADKKPSGSASGAGSDESPGFRERLADAEGAGAPFLWTLAPLLLVLIPGLVVGGLLLARRSPQQAAG
jgi:hypothetical protein